ncbi:Nuclear pore complex protein Nup107 [Eumeta japonica]|uniref:Nuclear pore complex protein Nup107 n=1 Tax=Eumeta variegata TaxID=151549 RepID=A0A4C1T9Z4_EUMVA|nr:Nuclear pore complex protein Nup107 [Eumeta japonica]
MANSPLPVRIYPQTTKRVVLGASDAKNVSITLMPSELERMLQSSNLHTSVLGSSFNTTAFADNQSLYERSVMDQTSMDMFKEKADILFPQFLEVLQGRTNDSEIFDTLQELIHTCSGVIEDCQKENMWTTEKNANRQTDWLEKECKTWKLLYALYKDRILIQNVEQDMDYDGLKFRF